MALGVTYRWLKGRGLDYQAVLMEYRERLEIVKNQDGAKPNIDMGGISYGHLGVNVPESAYGS